MGIVSTCTFHCLFMYVCGRPPIYLVADGSLSLHLKHADCDSMLHANKIISIIYCVLGRRTMTVRRPMLVCAISSTERSHSLQDRHGTLFQEKISMVGNGERYIYTFLTLIKPCHELHIYVIHGTIQMQFKMYLSLSLLMILLYICNFILLLFYFFIVF